MVVACASLNCEDKDYGFNMSAITEADCEEFAIKYVYKEGKPVKGAHINGIKVIVRDNIAKIILYYQAEGSLHEFKASLDPFGMKSQNYQDEISKIWQTIMVRHFGNAYQNALNAMVVNVNPNSNITI